MPDKSFDSLEAGNEVLPSNALNVAALTSHDTNATMQTVRTDPSTGEEDGQTASNSATEGEESASRDDSDEAGDISLSSSCGLQHRQAPDASDPWHSMQFTFKLHCPRCHTEVSHSNFTHSRSPKRDAVTDTIVASETSRVSETVESGADKASPCAGTPAVAEVPSAESASYPILRGADEISLPSRHLRRPRPLRHRRRFDKVLIGGQSDKPDQEASVTTTGAQHHVNGAAKAGVGAAPGNTKERLEHVGALRPGLPDTDSLFEKIFDELDRPSPPKGPATNAPEVDTEPTSPKDAVFVRYENVYLDPVNRGEVIYRQVAYNSAPLAGYGELDRGTAIFDVVTRFWSSQQIPRYERKRLPNRMLPRPPPVYGSTKTSLTIHSQTIIRALQHVVGYYPGFDLTRRAVHIEEPFAEVAHHYDALREYLRQHGRRWMDVPDEETINVTEHLDRFFEYADQKIMPPFYEELERHRRGKATWDMLWVLFKPGMDVAVRLVSSHERTGIVDRNGTVIEAVTYLERDSESDAHLLYLDIAPPTPQLRGRGQETASSPKGDTLRLKYWNLRCDGYKLGRHAGHVDIGYFDGELELSRLTVVPMELSLPLKNGDELRRHLVAQGKRYFNLLSPRMHHHQGSVMRYPFHHVSRTTSAAIF